MNPAVQVGAYYAFSAIFSAHNCVWFVLITKAIAYVLSAYGHEAVCFLERCMAGEPRRRRQQQQQQQQQQQ